MAETTDDKLIWFPTQLWIDGKWQPCRSGASLAVEDPACGRVVAEVPRAGESEAHEAVQSAARAMLGWRRLSPESRSQVLDRIRRTLLENREPLGRLLVAERGATLEQGRAEVDYAAAFFRWYSEEARRIYGRTIPHPDPTRRLRWEYFPIGVVAAITAWNGPLGLAAKKVAGALAAGCTVVLKPAELTPLSALALAWVTERAGLPAGALNVVFGDAPAIGRVLLEHRAVRMVTFTGSTRTGRYLASEAGKQIKRVALELGGNAPFLVFADADLDQAAGDLVWLKTINAGQVCVTANRILIERSIYQPLVARLVELLKRQRLGPGDDPEVTMGPLIDRRAVDKVKSLVESAVCAGAIISYQGEVPDRCQGGYYYPPTLLEGVTSQMQVACEEVFGPVLSVMPFDTEDQALRLANDTPFGLAAYVYTTNFQRAQRFSEELEAGVVGINDPRPITPEAPFGGIKQSGIGREGGAEGLMEFLEGRLIGLRFPGLGENGNLA